MDESTAGLSLDKLLSTAMAWRKQTELKQLLEQLGPGAVASSLENLLALAVSNNSVGITELLLDYGATASARIFMRAIWNGCLEIVWLLIEKGQADVNQPVSTTTNQQTPLIWASLQGHVEIVDLLLDEGALLDLPNKNGQTPLMMAVWNSKIEVVELLLRRGAHVDICDSNGLSALHWALSVDDNKALNLLLQHGASLNDQRQPVLNRAAFLGNLENAALLVANGALINISDAKMRWSPLMTASRYGHFDMCKFLLQNGANPNHKNTNGETALHWAAGNNRFEICRVLIENGAEADRRDNCGLTALHWASAYGSAQLLELLIDSGCEVNDPGSADGDGWTPLIIATANGANIDSCQALIDAGADVNQRTCRSLCGFGSGYTPLMIAAKRALIDLARVFLENGADFSAVSDDGDSAYSIALSDNIDEHSDKKIDDRLIAS